MLVFSPNGQKSIIGVIRPDNHAERIDCTIFTLDEYHEITKNLKLAVGRSKVKIAMSNMDFRLITLFRIISQFWR